MKKIYITTIFILSTLVTFSQTVIWSEDFANGIPATWQNYDPGNPTAIWDWSNTPNTPTFGGPAFVSSTASNGFAIFDSDLFGQNSHDVRLVTDAIDCSGLSSVFVRFENQYAYFSNGSAPQLGVSTDGNSFTYYNLFTTAPPQDLQTAIQIEEVDISVQAANQSTVYLQFRWVGVFEYAWKIDDITIQDAPTPPPTHNTAITAFNIAPNYATPLDHIDSMELVAEISNHGALLQTNVTLIAQVTDTTSQAVIFRDSIVIDSLLPGDNELALIEQLFLPTAIGGYQLEYFLRQDSIDQFRYDNYASTDFIITSDVFSKDNNRLRNIARPNIMGDYKIANVYKVHRGGYKAKEIRFRSGKSSGGLVGEQAVVILYEVDTAVDAIFSNFDINSNDDLTIVGSATYNFGLEGNDTEVRVDLLDFNTGDTGVVLQPDTRYFAAISYEGASNDLGIGISESLTYDFDIHTIIYGNNQWYLAGFAANNWTAHIRLVVEDTATSSTLRETTLLPASSIALYPNPTNNQLNITLNDVVLDNGRMIITDMQGRQLQDINIENRKNKQFSIDVSVLVSGIYRLTLITKEGVCTKPFVVTK